MFQLDFKDRRPIYEQIKEKMKFLIIGGAMKEGEKIPSVRELAVSMAINPNTIQKAYKELESEGYIYSMAAKGYFVTPRESTDIGKNAELLAKFSDTVRELMYLGKTKSELSDIINSIYKGGTNDGNDNC
ncbi:MAG: GntR family transcriptional regulator [Ruminococcaceae bacterium]|nr:GntR family transcriptional regulator [Oscillospiraceae bacterium]